jgi:hypothetical protein
MRETKAQERCRSDYEMLSKIKNPTLQQVDDYLVGTKGRGMMTTKLLGKLAPFIQAMSTEEGRQILQDDIDRHEELLNKWYMEEQELSVVELAELRYLKKRLQKISERVITYRDKVNEITTYEKGDSRNGS